MTERAEQAWRAVIALATRPRPDGGAPAAIRPLFAADPDRFARFSRRADGILLDLSKTAITEAAMAALLDLARAADLEGARAAMAAGRAVNATERRAVLHDNVSSGAETFTEVSFNIASTSATSVYETERVQ